MAQFFLQVRRPILLTAALVAAGLTTSAADAADALNPAVLTARAKAIALVDVKLGKGKERATVTLVRTLRGEAADLKPGAGWLSPCLPDRKDFTQWLRRHPKSPERTLWKEAAEKPGYQAVVFLAEGGRGLSPFCGGEAMDLLHTDLHSEYPSFLKRIEALVGAGSSPAL
jgi:hypothetical protein